MKSVKCSTGTNEPEGAKYGINRQRKLTVPLGLFHISFNLNSSTRASSGVMVAHLIPTWCSMMALAASMVT